MLDKNLYQISVEVGRVLRLKNMRLATAESCTGGLIAAAITSVIGSSAWFECGFVTYSNESKMALLHVRAETLQNYGAVSGNIAREMVIGALQNSKATAALSVTGIAGPCGGTEDKPVGTAYFGWMLKNSEPILECRNFSGDRNSIQLQAAIYSLRQLVEIVR